MKEHLLFAGDALEACQSLPAGVRFDLVYLDPPYAAGGTRTARLEAGQARAKGKSGSPAAYSDYGDTDALIGMLEPRIDAIRARMTPGATLWLHLDHRAVHEAKAMADRVFGRGAFFGEIIWVPGNGARGTPRFPMTHQTLLVYARSAADAKKVDYHADDPMLREPYAETSLAMHFKKRDADGRLYRERAIAGKTYRYYADEGRRLGSVWTDIPAMVANTPLRKEASGYPTQKPEKLLERIVRASSDEGDTVADLMCGSGTTLAVAAQLGRRFVGGDQSPLALGITRARLTKAGIAFREIAPK